MPKPLPAGKPAYLFTIPWYPVDTAGGVSEVVMNLYRVIEAGDRFSPALMINTWEPAQLPRHGRFVTIASRLRFPCIYGLKCVAVCNIDKRPDNNLCRRRLF